MLYRDSKYLTLSPHLALYPELVVFNITSSDSKHLQDQMMILFSLLKPFWYFPFVKPTTANLIGLHTSLCFSTGAHSHVQLLVSIYGLKVCINLATFFWRYTNLTRILCTLLSFTWQSIKIQPQILKQTLTINPYYPSSPNSLHSSLYLKI